MNLQRLLRLAAAFAAVAAAAAVCIVAAAFAVYAWLLAYLTAAGAAAVVAVIFALIALVVALLATRRAAPHRRRGEPVDDRALPDRLFSLAKERPLIALGAAAAGVTVLLRNPAVITALVSAFVAGTASKPRR